MLHFVATLLHDAALAAQNFWGFGLAAGCLAGVAWSYLTKYRFERTLAHPDLQLLRGRARKAAISCAASAALLGIQYSPLHRILPPEPEVTAWRVAPGATKALVLLHGWTGGNDTWKALAVLAQKDPKLVEFNILTVNYPTFMVRRNLDLPSLAVNVAALIDERLPGNEISIIAHSLGGVVARKIVLLEAQKTAGLKIRAVAAVASPHGGARWLAPIGSRLGISTTILPDIAEQSSFLSDLRISWNIYRSRQGSSAVPFRCFRGIHDAVVSEESAANLCDRFEQFSTFGHLDVVSPVSHDDDRYKKPVAAALE